MTLSCNRGGPKPPMLHTGNNWQSVPISIRGKRKEGIYERRLGVLARRVELPEWLSQGLQRGTIRLDSLAPHMPREEIGESRGQIYINPPRDLFTGPAVGLDIEVFNMLEADNQISFIRFYVYGSAYRLVDVWEIGRQRFLDLAKPVYGDKPSFMPQMMVPLSALSTSPSAVLHRALH